MTRPPRIARTLAPVLAIVGLLASASPAGAVVDFSPSASSPIQVTSNFTSDLARGDFNEDGHPDLAVAAGDRAAVLLNDGSGGFSVHSPFLGERVEGVAVGDFNGDSHQDIAAATTVQAANPRVPTVEVLLGDGTGSFTEAPGSPFAIGAVPGCSGRMVAANFNGDAYDDLAVVNSPCQATVPTVSVMLGSNTGALSVAAGSPFNPFSPDDPGFIQGIAAGKLNNDANVDLAVASSSLNQVAVLGGDGSGGFSALSGSPYSTGDAPLGVVLDEFSQPPRLDLAVANSQSNDVSVFENNGLGVYSVPADSPFSVGVPGSPNPRALAAGDLNGDGQPDLAVANGNSLTPNVSVLVHDGVDHFHPAPLGPFDLGESSQFAAGQAVAIADFDGDGRLDIAVATGSPGSVSILENASGPPSEPVFTATEPDSPSNANSPMIRGTAGLEGSIELWKNSNCAGSPDFTGPVSDFTSGGIQVSVPDNSTTTFHAKAVDGEGSSGCSNSTITYVEDSIAPGVPTLSGTNPSSPGNDTSPNVLGSAEPGSTVKLYPNGSCSGSPAALGISGATFAVPMPVSADTTTTITAKATDPAGNTSPCTPTSISYTEDSTPPVEPALASISPASPANDNSPVISGSAEAGATVKLYGNAGCSGSPAASGSAASFGSPGFTVAVADDSTTTFHATATDGAGNVSPCSTASLTYQEDSTAPPAPLLSGSDPRSPGSSIDPRIGGTAQDGSTVKLFTTGDCSGPPLLTGNPGTLASPGLPVHVPDNSSTQFRATATDAAGNVSACSAPFTYVEDSVAPDTEIRGSPPRRSHRRQAVFSFSSSEAGSSFVCSLGGADFSPCSSPKAYRHLARGSHVFRVAAIDAAGNVDPVAATFGFRILRHK